MDFVPLSKDFASLSMDFTPLSKDNAPLSKDNAPRSTGHAPHGDKRKRPVAALSLFPSPWQASAIVHPAGGDDKWGHSSLARIARWPVRRFLTRHWVT
jgi:hypothetical protein